MIGSFTDIKGRDQQVPFRRAGQAVVCATLFSMTWGGSSKRCRYGGGALGELMNLRRYCYGIGEGLEKKRHY